MGYLDEIGGAQPFGEGGTHRSGVELKIAVGSADGFIEWQVQQASVEPLRGDAVHAGLR